MPLVVQLILLGLGTGIFVGMFGIGGGAVMVPAMVLLLGFDQKMASGTSLAAQILPIGLLGAMVYYKDNNMNLKYAVIIAIGLFIGAYFGARFANQPYVSNEQMKKYFGVFLFVVSMRYLLLK